MKIVLFQLLSLGNGAPAEEKDEPENNDAKTEEETATNDCIRKGERYVNQGEEDLNLQGGVKVTTASAELCLKVCKKLEDCEEWTWSSKDNFCYPKKAGGKLEEMATSTSGTKNCKDLDELEGDLVELEKNLDELAKKKDELKEKKKTLEDKKVKTETEEQELKELEVEEKANDAAITVVKDVIKKQEKDSGSEATSLSFTVLLAALVMSF